MSSKKFDKQSESSKYSCLCHRSLKNQQKLIESGEIFSWRDKDGFNALMHAATLRCSDRSESNIFTFDFLFNQKVQPAYSANEKADALELIGSSCILFKYKLDTGLYYWRESFRYRCAPRRRLPEASLPAVTRQFTMPEWTDCDDVNRMLRGQNPIVNVAYQAILVRLRVGIGLRTSDYLKIFDYYTKYYFRYDGRRVINMIKWTQMMFEWDALYGSHSLSLLHFSVKRAIHEFTSSLKEITENKAFRNDRHLICFENLMVVLKWLATVYEKLIADLETERIGRSPRSRSTYMSVLIDIIQFIGVLQNMALDKDQTIELKRNLYRIVQADRRNNFYGRNLFHEACCWQTPATVSLLVELGADVNSVDQEGSTCLHQLLHARPVPGPADLSLVKFLLDNGAHPDQANKNGCTPMRFYRIFNKGDQGPLPFPSLKCICAKVLQQNYVDISNENLSKGLIEFVKIH